MFLAVFYWQAKPILKRKIPFDKKPLRKEASPKINQEKKSLLNKHKFWAYYRNFTVFAISARRNVYKQYAYLATVDPDDHRRFMCSNIE